MSVLERVACWPGHRWLTLLARLYLGTLFVAASLHKIAHPGSFAVDIATYQILPLRLVNLWAIILPYVELGAGLLLIIGWHIRGAALLVAAMLLVFTVALASALARGLDASCGCFASAALNKEPISLLTVLRDLGWSILAVYVLVYTRSPVERDSAPAQVGGQR